MRIENQLLVEKLFNIRGDLSALIGMLDEDCSCNDAIQKIQMVKVALDSFVIKIIHHQLKESLASIEANPSIEAYDDELNRLVDLYQVFITGPIYYQLTRKKVEHE